MLYLSKCSFLLPCVRSPGRYRSRHARSPRWSRSPTHNRGRRSYSRTPPRHHYRPSGYRSPGYRSPMRTPPRSPVRSSRSPAHARGFSPRAGHHSPRGGHHSPVLRNPDGRGEPPSRVFTPTSPAHLGHEGNLPRDHPAIRRSPTLSR